MGRRLFYGCSVLIFILSILVFVWIGHDSPSSCAKEERESLHYFVSEVEECQEQRREGVTKEFWFSEKKVVLEALQSALYLEGASTLVEWMEPIQGTVDDGDLHISYQAPRALFYYSDKKIAADDVHVVGVLKKTEGSWKGNIETVDFLLEPTMELKGLQLEVEGEEWKSAFDAIAFHADEKIWLGKGYQITYKDHILSSAQGTASWKQDEQVVYLESPYQGEQLLFHDSMGEILADRAILYLKEMEGKIGVDQVDLEGHVRLRNLFVDGPLPFEQFGLADRLTFYPATLEMQLKAAPKEKVIFVDHEHGIQMSAKGLTLIRGEKEPQVKGEGKVSLRLTSKEFDQIQQVIQYFKKGTS